MHNCLICRESRVLHLRPYRSEGDTCSESAFSAAVRSWGGLGAGGPPSPDVWLYLESDAEVLAVPAADNESTADQILSGLLEFLELLAVPFGYLSVEEPHDVAIDQDRNGCRLARISRHQCREVSIELMTPWPGSGCCLAQ